MPNYHILDYSLFVTFFPQLVAGPIVLHSEIIPQFDETKKTHFNYENQYKGLYIFSVGLAKKVILADSLWQVVNLGYSDISSMGTITVCLVIISYTFQIYLDFSGYCDMAVGIGKFFNIDLPMNFNSPYKSLTVEDFWKRWHMTLTRFFTTYLYIPLGGNRISRKRTYLNYFIVFMMSGLWHGANWTFIVWGMLHGLAILFCKSFKKTIVKIPWIFNWIATFIFINITWVIFRASSLQQAGLVLKEIVSFDFSIPTYDYLSLLYFEEMQLLYNLFLSNILEEGMYIILVIVILYMVVIYIVLFKNNAYYTMRNIKPTIKTNGIIVFNVVYSIISLTGVTVFLYFNF